ncbi:DUF2971 domain-containing protein [Clostridium thermobutyricum]|uniref:DUF2971 domain-containing protein n=1 Tax=Clostridium thermobutyricum DSM 4928 TaxID=1121339 RepID=A0A1V4STJ8_9CLOT|nr:DUF2971 domain-containing protein [Clostridium thermobutyricum]OPX46621.1 hypothetical protein CLTHE_28420 [Clostridium thermobutyricum DSM 4928]
MNKPEYLYHYTNIDTLALILKNKTIRFNSLSNMDDLEEVKSNDMGNIGKYCFVSCWTEEEEESIPFWHIYTNKMRGIRIKLPSDMFKKYTVNNIGSLGSFKSYFKYEEILCPNYTISPSWVEILEKVEYTDDKSLLYPNILELEVDKCNIKLGELGKHKRKNWNFQKEWRYIFRILPISLREMQEENPNVHLRKLLKGEELGIDSYFLNIDDKALEKMEITLGPNTTDGDKIIVESLVNTYNPLAKVYSSNLKKIINIK